jgi:hypothetical protein
MKFRAIKDNGKLNVNWERIGVYLSRFKDGTVFDIEITRQQRTKSSSMRKYYFGVVLPLFLAHLGYEKDEDELLHRQLKIVYFRIKPDAKGIYRHVPTVFSDKSDIPVAEKAKFLEWTVRKAAQEGVYIPDANES